MIGEHRSGYCGSLLRDVCFYSPACPYHRKRVPASEGER